jgi:kumamolisin
MAPKKAAKKSTPAKSTKKLVTNFSTEEKQILPGSEKEPFHVAGEKAAAGKITVSVILRRKSPLNTKNLGKVRISRADYAKNHAADKSDIKLVHAFAAEFGLSVHKDTPKPERRTVLLTGSVAAMQEAFGVELKEAEIDGETYRVREGGIHIPASLSGVVTAVLGLDNRPQAQPHFQIANAVSPQSGLQSRAAEPAANTAYNPVQIAALYGFPTASAAGQTIGIIELGGGFRAADIAAYAKSLGQKTPSVIAVSVDGGKNSPGTTSTNGGADVEVMLDIEVAASVAVGAKIVVYFAPNTDQGFIDAIATAVHDTTNKPSVISISWGGPETSWTQQSLTALDAACQSAAALGVTITVAAGDRGSTDGTKSNVVDFPASSPHVLACGGTKLIGSGSTITSEVVWNEGATTSATGGGVSVKFPLPTWQASAKVPKAGSYVGRGVPDVAGDADPNTGYSIRVDGQTLTIGGTSAVAPLWAGLLAVSNAINKKSAGFIQPTIYATKGKTAFRDITSGNNGGYSAAVGWDACTGLGSPVGGKLVTLLAGAAATAKTAAKKASEKKAAKAKK